MSNLRNTTREEILTGTITKGEIISRGKTKGHFYYYMQLENKSIIRIGKIEIAGLRFNLDKKISLLAKVKYGDKCKAVSLEVLKWLGCKEEN